MYKNASLYLNRKKKIYNNFLNHYWQIDIDEAIQIDNKMKSVLLN